MICHKYKCIFIHIPRCAGTSIEKSIIGKDWWHVEPTTKHILASTAKNLYTDYWDDYFKFSFVRNPWSRMVSMAKYPKEYGPKIVKNKLNLINYKKLYPNGEIDPRMKLNSKNPNSLKNSVYLNIIDRHIDFIGHFENLQHDFEVVCNAIRFKGPLTREETSPFAKHKHYTEYYDEETKSIVAEKYAKDIEYFGYKFGK